MGFTMKNKRIICRRNFGVQKGGFTENIPMKVESRE
jgi:hypothetical protein